MQTALQNPHYKKIWEKINWQIRHPEAKSLGEALKMETKERYCQYILTDNDNYIVDGDYISKYYHHNNNYEILGTAITLEDILILLNGKFTHLRMQDGYYIFENTTYNYPNNNEYTGTIIRSTTIFKLKIRTEFEDETPETWETMANLID